MFTWTSWCEFLVFVVVKSIKKKLWLYTFHGDYYYLLDELEWRCDKNLGDKINFLKNIEFIVASKSWFEMFSWNLLEYTFHDYYYKLLGEREVMSICQQCHYVLTEIFFFRNPKNSPSSHWSPWSHRWGSCSPLSWRFFSCSPPSWCSTSSGPAGTPSPYGEWRWTGRDPLGEAESPGRSPRSMRLPGESRGLKKLYFVKFQVTVVSPPFDM